MKYEETLFISKAENRQINRYLKKRNTGRRQFQRIRQL